MTKYYSEKHKTELLELSDKHIGWLIERDIDIDEYNILVRRFCVEFEKIYNTPIILSGRSGRHVCVYNEDKNRKRICNMLKTVERLQNSLIKEINKE